LVGKPSASSLTPLTFRPRAPDSECDPLSSWSVRCFGAGGSAGADRAFAGLRFARGAPVKCGDPCREDELPPAAQVRMHLGCGAPLAQRMEGAWPAWQAAQRLTGSEAAPRSIASPHLCTSKRDQQNLTLQPQFASPSLETRLRGLSLRKNASCGRGLVLDNVCHLRWLSMPQQRPFWSAK